MATTYQTPDAKKEEFRKYLEKAGVIDSMTKVLVGLYEEPERPPNAVDYIKQYLGAAAGTDVDALRAENERLREMNDSLMAENADLRAELTSLQDAAEAAGDAE